MDKSTHIAHATAIACVIEQRVCSGPLARVVVQPTALGVASAHVEKVTFIHSVEARQPTKQLVHFGNATGQHRIGYYTICV